MQANDCQGNGILTLCENEIILLDEGLEGVLLELVDVGGEGNGSQDGADRCDVTHCEVLWRGDWGRAKV